MAPAQLKITLQWNAIEGLVISYNERAYSGILAVSTNALGNPFISFDYQHNVSGYFLSLRMGLCAIGNGEVKFESFEYKPLSKKLNNHCVKKRPKIELGFIY